MGCDVQALAMSGGRSAVVVFQEVRIPGLHNGSDQEGKLQVVTT
jgi:hypothetical protein